MPFSFVLFTFVPPNCVKRYVRISPQIALACLIKREPRTRTGILLSWPSVFTRVHAWAYGNVRVSVHGLPVICYGAAPLYCIYRDPRFYELLVHNCFLLWISMWYQIFYMFSKKELGLQNFPILAREREKKSDPYYPEKRTVTSCCQFRWLFAVKNHTSV